MKNLLVSFWFWLFAVLVLSPLTSRADPVLVYLPSFHGTFANVASTRYNSAGDLFILGPDGTVVKTYAASEVTDNVSFRSVFDVTQSIYTLWTAFENRRGGGGFLPEERVASFHYQVAGPTGGNLQSVVSVKSLGGGFFNFAAFNGAQFDVDPLFGISEVGASVLETLLITLGQTPWGLQQSGYEYVPPSNGGGSISEPASIEISLSLLIVLLIFLLVRHNKRRRHRR